jgi:hypothetical protein
MSTNETTINYLPLFDPPRSRNSDPVSSHEAEREMKASGRMTEQAEAVLRLIKQFPGWTSKQLGTCQPGLDRYQVARRCSDLEFMHLVYSSGRDRPGQLRWFPERRRVVRETK